MASKEFDLWEKKSSVSSTALNIKQWPGREKRSRGQVVKPSTYKSKNFLTFFLRVWNQYFIGSLKKIVCECKHHLILYNKNKNSDSTDN